MDENAIFVLNILEQRTDSSSDLTLSALEQLCLLVLQTENNDELNKHYPPASFVPILAKLFLDFDCCPSTLEAASRVITYYIQSLPIESALSLFSVDGAVCAICIRLESSNLHNQIENDLSQQIIKILEELAKRDTNIYKLVIGMPCVFEFISKYWRRIHLDTLRSGLLVLCKLSPFLDTWLKGELGNSSVSWTSNSGMPTVAFSLQCWIANLIELISHRDSQVSFTSLDCLYIVINSCQRLPISWNVLELLVTKVNLIEKLLGLLLPIGGRIGDKSDNAESCCTNTSYSLQNDQTEHLEENDENISKTNNPVLINDSYERKQLDGQSATLLVDAILVLCQGKMNLLSTIANSVALKNLFTSVLNVTSVKVKDSSLKSTVHENVMCSSDMIIPVLYLADGLLNLAMTSPMISDEKQDDHIKNITDSQTPGNRSVCNVQTGNKHENIDQTSGLHCDRRQKWLSNLTARQPNVHSYENSVNFVGKTLHKNSSTNSTYSCSNSSNQSLSISSPSMFLLAKQGFEQIGIADELKISSDRFHYWFLSGVANRLSMGDLLSIFYSGQVSSLWTDYWGQSPLAWTLAYGNAAATLALCQRGVNVNSGLTGSAIHYAICYGQVQSAMYLLGFTKSSVTRRAEFNTVNPRLRDLEGRTPVQLCLQALVAAKKRGENVNRYEKLLDAVQKSEEKFKYELNGKMSSPFKTLLHLSLPILIEAYMTTTRPEIRIQVLQILCQLIRSRTGFIVLYQMQRSNCKCDKTTTIEDDSQTTNEQSINFADKLVHMIASVIGQGSTEEVFLVLSLIPALIDQPEFLNWMHKHGLPEILLWRAKIYKKTTDNINVDKKSTGVESNELFKETVPFCLPAYILKPKPCRFQCTYQLAIDQAYSYGDWTILRNGFRSLIVFHEFALLWFIYKKTYSTYFNLCTNDDVDDDVGDDHEDNDSTSLSNKAYELKVYLITRKESTIKSENSINWLQSTSSQQYEDHNNLTDNNSQDNTMFPVASYNPKKNDTDNLCRLESMNGLCVSEIQFSGKPVNRNDLLPKIWNKLLPLLIKIKHMHYGMLPLPVQKSSSPLTNPSKYNQSLQIPSQKISKESNHLEASQSFSENYTIYNKKKNNTPVQLKNTLNVSLSSTAGHCNTEKETSSLVVAQTSQILSHIESNPLSKNELSKQPELIFDINKAGPSLKKVNCSDDYPSLLKLSPTDEELQSSVNQTIDDSHLSKGNEMKISRKKLNPSTMKRNNDAMMFLKQSKSSANLSETSTQSIGYTTTNEYSSLNMDQPSCTLTQEKINKIDVNCREKLVSTFFWNMKLSVSFHGLWFTLESVNTSHDDDNNNKNSSIDEFCIHPECKNRWNPDFRDDETDYIECADDCYSVEEIKDENRSTSILSDNAVKNDRSRTQTCADRLELQGIERIFCHQTKLGGVMVYAKNNDLIYQSGPLTKNTGYAKHREIRLHWIRRTVAYASIILSKLLNKLMIKAVTGTVPKHLTVQYNKKFLKCQTTLTTQLRNYVTCISEILCMKMDSKTSGSVIPCELKVNELFPLIEKATPHEILESGIVSLLSEWFKFILSNIQNEYSAKIPIKLLGDLHKDAHLYVLNSSLTYENIEILAKKLISVLELTEHFPVSTFSQLNLSDQLLTSPLRLCPQLIEKSVAEILNKEMFIGERQPYFRQVDISGSYVSVQPLVTVKQLQDWILKTAAKIPWYMDELHNLGFVHDVNVAPCYITLLPPKHLMQQLNESPLESPQHSYHGGIFNWIGTNGGREVKWANPLRLNGFVRLMSSDRKLNQKPQLLGYLISREKTIGRSTSKQLNRLNCDHVKSEGKKLKCGKPIKSANKLHEIVIGVDSDEASFFQAILTPWVAFDLGVLLEITHYSIQVNLLSNNWPSLTSWQLQASNNGFLWKAISEHHIMPTGDPKVYWGLCGEKLWKINVNQCYKERSWRFFRIQLLPTKTMSSNKLCFRSIEFYGNIHKVYTSADEDTQLNAISYLNEFQPNAYVVPDIPVLLHERVIRDSWEDLDCEIWPPTSFDNEAKTEYEQPLPENSKTSLNYTCMFGRIVSLESTGRVTVEWLSDFQTTDLEWKHRIASHALDIKGRCDIRLATDREIQMHSDLIRKAISQIKNETQVRTSLSPSDEQHCEDTSLKRVDATMNKNMPDSLTDQLVEESMICTKEIQSETAQVSLTQITSYFLPLSFNWLAGALIPMFSRITPFLFASGSPNIIRDSPTTNTEVSNYSDTTSLYEHGVLCSTQTTSVEPYHQNTIPEERKTLESTFNKQKEYSIDKTLPKYQSAESHEPVQKHIMTTSNFIHAAEPSSFSSHREVFETHLSTPLVKQSSFCHHQNKISDFNLPKNFEETKANGVQLTDQNKQLGIKTCLNTFVYEKQNDKASVRDYENACSENYLYDTDNYTDPNKYAIQPNHSSNLEVSPSENDLDDELEVFKQTVDMTVSKNAQKKNLRAQNNSSPQFQLDLPICMRKQNQLKIDQWENIDSVNFETILDRCMNLKVLTDVQFLQLFEKKCEGVNSDSPSSIPSLKQDYPESKSLINKTSSYTCGPHFHRCDHSSNSENSLTLQPSEQSPIAPITIRSDSYKQSSFSTLKPPNPPSMKTDKLLSQLPGFIPPFETRSRASNEPSTVRFEIPKVIKDPKYKEPSPGPSLLRNKRNERKYYRARVFVDFKHSSNEKLQSANPMSSAKCIQNNLIAHSTRYNVKERSFNLIPNTETFGAQNSSHYLSPYCLKHENECLISYMLIQKLIPSCMGYYNDETFIEQLLNLLSMLYEIANFKFKNHAQDLIRCQETSEASNTGCCGTNYQYQNDQDCYDYPSQLERITEQFHSYRLNMKINSYCKDILSVLSMSKFDISQWIYILCTRYNFIIPFETRLQFWKVSCRGTSRAIAFFQKHTGINRALVTNQPSNTTELSSLPYRTEMQKHIRSGQVSEFENSFSWRASVVLMAKEKTDSDFTSTQSTAGHSLGSTSDVNTRPYYSNIIGTSAANQSSLRSGRFGTYFNSNQQNHLSNLGRLQRHMAVIPRPQNNFQPNTQKRRTDNCNEFYTPSSVDSLNNDPFWSTVVRLLLSHANLKQELEIEFDGEEGTGLGPTMEFYALLSAELRRYSHGLWVTDDRDTTNETKKLSNISYEDNTNHIENPQDDSPEDKSQNDFYVNPSMGLFPAPWPSNRLPPGCELRFYVLGIAVAKCLQDERQMDLPFSNAFLCLLCNNGKASELDDLINDKKNGEGVSRSQSTWFYNTLDIKHFAEIYPERGKFLLQLKKYQYMKSELLYKYNGDELIQKDLELQTRLFSTDLESLCLTMSFPSVSKNFGFSEFPLKDVYDWENDNNYNDLMNENEKECETVETLTTDLIDAYIRRSFEFAMQKGIQKQMNAFKNGFERVLPFNSLSIFLPYELGRLISGESIHQWTFDELWMYCEPAAGYTRKSRGFQMLIKVLADLDANERRSFICFVTGCPTLPPGGIKNIHPKIKVARKDGTTCGLYPSVNTCMHYLKLPEYNTEQELKQHLLAAACQKGFYLN
ncbi:unnamed protein product [Trichobilharzia szidati]|nr:unnamed protein product [Trichobilharzia szidati]